VPGAGQYLELVELALCKKFILVLLQVCEPVDDVFCQLLSHGVKMGGIAIKNPITSMQHLHQCSMDASNILVKALHNGGRGPQGCGQSGWKRCLQGKTKSGEGESKGTEE
jgi:hypothetical protein